MLLKETPQIVNSSLLMTRWMARNRPICSADLMMGRAIASSMLQDE